MKILSVNAGSSSLKFQMYEMPEEKVLISGYVERIGLDGGFWNVKVDGKKIKTEGNLANHSEAVAQRIQYNRGYRLLTIHSAPVAPARNFSFSIS